MGISSASFVFFSVTLGSSRNISRSVTGHRGHQSFVGREKNESKTSSPGHSCVCVTLTAPGDL